MGSALTGSLHLFVFFDGGTFWVLPLTCFDLPKSARAYLIPQSVKFMMFAAASLVLTPFVRKHMCVCVFLLHVQCACVCVCVRILCVSVCA